MCLRHTTKHENVGLGDLVKAGPSVLQASLDSEAWRSGTTLLTRSRKRDGPVLL